MPETDIYLNLDQLNTGVIVLNNKKIQEIDSTMRSALNIVNKLALHDWEGDSRDSFVANFTEYKKTMTAFSLCVKEFTKQLKTVHGNGKKLNSQSGKIAAKV